MGTWKLEVAKMTMYMMFPVAIFHYFNQPAYFEEWVTNMKRELYPPEAVVKHKEMQVAIKKIRDRQELQMLEALENSKV